MPSIAKQRRVNRSKVLVKRTQRFAGHPKLKPFNPLCGKLKSNNSLLAKALSIQKQENQILDTQNIELTKQLQALRMACNKRDIVCTNINHSAKELLALLVNATNHVTNIIVASGEFVSTSNRTTILPSPVSNTRRDSTRRLSIKSPAKGVVKPMVSGHTITKPTITLQRLNMQGYAGNFLDLSIIEEGSPRSANLSLNNSGTRTVGITGVNRLGYEGERRRRLPERIPPEYVGDDDDEGVPVSRQEPRRSVGRFSGRLSNSYPRKRSGDTPMGQIRSPSVSLCDVSKLLQNSQTINVKMLRDSHGNGDIIGFSNTPPNVSRRIDDTYTTPTAYMTAREFQGARRSLDKTLQSSSVLQGDLLDRSTNNVEQRNTNSEIDPIEGPSWLLNGFEANPSFENTDPEETVEIVRKKTRIQKLKSSDSEPEEESILANDSMEFTECINPTLRRLEIPIPRLGKERNYGNSNVVNNSHQDELEENIDSKRGDSSDPSSPMGANFSNNRSTDFVTDRRRGYSQDDDDDEPDTIMLQFSRAPRPKVANLRFDINDFRLPVVNSPIMVPVEPDDSEPEVTRTIKIIPQNYAPPTSIDDSIDYRDSSIQLPRINDQPKAKKTAKRSAKTIQPRKNVKFTGNDSSDSDSTFESNKKTEKDAKTKKSTEVKDPSSAKVVLKKLDNTNMRMRSITPDQSLLNASNQKTFEGRNSELLTESNSSTYSSTESGRPRRQKAPTNLKERSIGTKLRRDF